MTSLNLKLNVGDLHHICTLFSTVLHSYTHSFDLLTKRIAEAYNLIKQINFNADFHIHTGVELWHVLLNVGNESQFTKSDVRLKSVPDQEMTS